MIRQVRQPLLLTILIFWLQACSQPIPEAQQIRLVMDEMQKSADGRDLPVLMKHFHASFLGNRGMHKQQLQGLIYFYFRTNPQVRTYISNASFKIEGEDAEVSCHLLVTGSRIQLPEKGRLYRVTSSWKKIDDTWQVVEAEWEDVVGETLEELDS